MADSPTPEQLRAEGAKRANSFAVSTLFNNRATRSSYGTDQSHVIPRTRCNARLAADMAAFGNAHGWTPSETVRYLIRAGLDHAKETS